jgi:predicted nicotinamide N-methyase
MSLTPGAGAILRELIFPCAPKPSVSLPSSPKARRRSTLTPSNDITLKLHDAAIDDHTAVGVQTWGSCILLGRMMSSEPKQIFDLPCLSEDSPLRILELGAGTGLLSMLCHEILNKRQMLPLETAAGDTRRTAEIIATDYHPLVLDNMRKCIDLNFPNDTYLDLDASDDGEASGSEAGLGVMPLDWMVFPQQAEKYHRASGRNSPSNGFEAIESNQKASPYAADSIWKPTASEETPDADSDASAQQLNSHLISPFDMILAADCVYDTAHAGMIRDCVKWALRLPEVDSSGNVVREGGVLVSLLIDRCW